MNDIFISVLGGGEKLRYTGGAIILSPFCRVISSQYAYPFFIMNLFTRLPAKSNDDQIGNLKKKEEFFP